MKRYKIGFSLKGLIAFFVVMFPNIIWMIYPPANDLLTMNSSHSTVLNILMSISQWIMIAMIILLLRVDKIHAKSSKLYILSGTLCLSLYYISWVCYYSGVILPIMLLGMAIFPCAFFLIYIFWQRLFPALIPGIIFSIVHIGMTFTDFIITK